MFLFLLDRVNLIIKWVNFINIVEFTHLRLTKKGYKYVKNETFIKFSTKGINIIKCLSN